MELSESKSVTFDKLLNKLAGTMSINKQSQLAVEFIGKVEKKYGIELSL